MKIDELTNYRVTERLRNGSEVTIRAIRPEDKELVLEAFKGLEENTIYMRFFTLKKDVTERELKWATEVDFSRTVALVACILESGRERIIGGGRYITVSGTDMPSGAEVAFVVEEDFQGLGLASMLLKHLVSIAREQGISRFEAEVLPSNKAMFKVFSRAGLTMTTVRSEDSVHVSIFLNKGETE